MLFSILGSETHITRPRARSQDYEDRAHADLTSVADPNTPPPNTPFIDLTTIGSPPTFSSIRGPTSMQQELSPSREPAPTTSERHSLFFMSAPFLLDEAHQPAVSTSRTASPELSPTNISASDRSTEPVEEPRVSIISWEMEVLRMNPRERRMKRALTLTAPSEQIAAQALFQKILSHYEGVEHSLPVGSQIAEWDFSNLISGTRSIRV